MKLNYDPIWFGVMLTIVTTMGAITPPVGVNAYVVAGMSKDISLNTVFKGVTYFLPTYIICIIMLELFPSLVMFLAGAVK